jgi:hypothetical protein
MKQHFGFELIHFGKIVKNIISQFFIYRHTLGRKKLVVFAGQ